jgi:hypothetical protein
MNILSTLDRLAQSLFGESSEAIGKVSDKVSVEVSERSEAIPTKQTRNIVENDIAQITQKQDLRRKPRTQKQIETYKKNFGNRHRVNSLVVNSVNKSVYDKIFS